MRLQLLSRQIVLPQQLCLVRSEYADFIDHGYPLMSHSKSIDAIVGVTAVPVAASLQAIVILTSNTSPATKPAGVIVNGTEANTSEFIVVAAVAQRSEPMPVILSSL